MDFTKDNYKISSELAEICGIHAGDGYLRNDGVRIEWDISGNVEERDYYDYHMIPIFNKVFNLNLKGRFFPHRNTYGFVIRDPKIIEFIHRIGFPYGNKSIKVRIPISISKSVSLSRKFLRGYFDTDGCINFDKKIGNSSIFKKTRHYYPRILITTCSPWLAEEVKNITKLLGFKTHIYQYKPKISTENIKYRIQIAGYEAIEAWMRLIGTKNSSKLSRYLIWKRFGFCPPNTTYEQRAKILKGELNPNSLYGPVA